MLIYHGINDLFVNHVDNKYFKNDYSHMLPWYKSNLLLNNSLVARLIYNKFKCGRRIFGMKKVWFIYSEKDKENAMNYVSEKLFRRNITILKKKLKKKVSCLS